MNNDPTANATTPDGGIPFAPFVTDYVASLLERTRPEKGGIVFGLDWVVYNLAVALGWQAVRLPFFRNAGPEPAKVKTETEFGIDLSFLTPGHEELRILVLKDEALTNGNWTRNGFDYDLRRAACPDLGGPDMAAVRRVVVTLVYNKDEDAAGLKLFENLSTALGTRICDDVELAFERWNLTRVGALIQEHLLSPSLMPQHLSGLFSYICSQFSDFEYGSEAWDRQLVPNWKRFLDEVLKGRITESVLRLIPVALVILDRFRTDKPSWRIGWLDLTEWAMLKLWQAYPTLGRDELKARVFEAWIGLYLVHVEMHLLEVSPALVTEHGIHTRRCGFFLDSLNDTCTAYWHLERVAIHMLGLLEVMRADTPEAEDALRKLILRAADWTGKCLRMNPCTLRPLLDLHHVSLYLVWRVLWEARRIGDIGFLLTGLEARLFLRRLPNSEIPFIEGYSRLDMVAEAVATGQKPPEFLDSSSYLLRMLTELTFSLDQPERDALLDRYVTRVIGGIASDGERYKGTEPINVIDWVPPDDWSRRVLSESVRDGIGISSFSLGKNKEASAMADEIRAEVEESRRKFPWKLNAEVPASVLILACIKNRCPLPSFFWRAALFPTQEESTRQESTANPPAATRSETATGV